MAKKPVRPSEEPVTIAEQVQQQIDDRASKFLGEEVKNGEIVEKPEEKPAEEVTPEEKPQEPAYEEIEFDPEKQKKEIIEETKAAIEEALKGATKEETKENVDEYVEFQKQFNEKEKREPTWFEVAKFMEERAVTRLEEKQAAQQKEAEEQATKQRDTLTRQNDETNKYIKDTLDELYSNEKLPRIQDMNNPDDYGLKVQKELFNTIISVNQTRLEKQMPPKTLKEIFYEDFKMPEKEVAGAHAPVNMGRGGYTPDADNQEINYAKDIRGKSIRQIMMNAFKR